MKNFLLLVFFQSSFLFSQNRKVDSLWAVFSNENQSDTNRFKALNTIAWSYMNFNPDTAIILAKQAVELAQKIQIKKYEGWAMNTIGGAYVNKSNYSMAKENYLKSLRIFESIIDKKAIGICYNNLGNVSLYSSDYPNALQYYLKALRIAEENKDKKGIADNYSNIGIVFENQFNFQKSLDYYFSALKMRQENGDRIGVGGCYGNIGSNYLNQKNYQKALEYNFKSLKIQEENKNEDGIANCCGNIALAYQGLLKYSNALEYYIKAVNMYRKTSDLQGRATCYQNLGVLYNNLSDFKLALRYGDSALQIGKEIEDVDNQRLTYQNMSFVYEKMGKYKNAYEFHILFKQLTDSIFNEENSKQLGDMRTNFEVEKKEIELKTKAATQELIAAEEKKRYEIIIYTVAGLLALVMVFAGFMFNRFKVTQKQKHIIEIKENETQQQKHIIEEKHKEITDSINYAERIQRSFLATKELLDENLSSPWGDAEGGGGNSSTLGRLGEAYFVLFKPKDVVSGDFYWASKVVSSSGVENFALVTADSTGHGVPGAIMSLLNITSLEGAVKDGFTEPAEILNATRKTIIERLKKDGSKEGGKDGMDASLICFDFKNKKLIISAANNPVWIMRTKPATEPVEVASRTSATTATATSENTASKIPSPKERGFRGEAEVIEIKPDKMPVGKHDKDQMPFTQQTIDLQSGDVIYALTDGFPDQFGGEKGKKFMSKNLRELLAANSHLPMHEQKQLLEKTFSDWVGNLEQVDDVTIIGVRV